MTDRRAFILGVTGSLMAAARIGRAQQRTESLGMIGILNSWPTSLRPSSRPSASPRMLLGAAATGDLRDQIEALTARHGKFVEWVSFPDNAPVTRLSEQARALIQSNVATIVAVGTAATIAAAEATTVIPIVMVGVADPVALGLIQSLPRPEKNVTGVSLLGPEILEKSLELLLEAAPSIRRPAVLWNPANPGAALSLQHLERAATVKGLNVVSAPIERAEGLEGVLADLGQLAHDAVILISDPVFPGKADRILQYCSRQRLPTLFSTADWVMKGGLISYEPEASELSRRAAAYVVRILLGAKPRDLPVEQPTTFRLTVNAKAAKALGLTMPQSLLVRADEVIE